MGFGQVRRPVRLPVLMMVLMMVTGYSQSCAIDPRLLTQNRPHILAGYAGSDARNAGWKAV